MNNQSVSILRGTKENTKVVTKKKISVSGKEIQTDEKIKNKNNKWKGDTNRGKQKNK